MATEAPNEASAAVVEASQGMLEQEFATATDPSGAAWASRVPPTGSWPLLRKTGGMYGSRRIVPIPGGADITVDRPAEFHQRGTRRMVARPILPSGALPAPWAKAVQEAGAARVRALMGAL